MPICSSKLKFLLIFFAIAILFLVGGFSLWQSQLGAEAANLAPQILNASVKPEKVRPGNIMTITTEIKDNFGIKSVTADMGGIETIELSLKEGDNRQGIWQKEWRVYGVEPQDYIATIVAQNILDKTTTKEVKWSDPPDIETLRPNATGSETGWSWTTPSSGVTHWYVVSDETYDEDITRIRTFTVPQRDLYQLPDHSQGNGTINKITVFFRSKTYSGTNNYDAASIKTYGTVFDGDAQQLTTLYQAFSQVWATNPSTTAPWTWEEIDNLEIGVKAASGGGWHYCTQVYVEIDYTPGVTPCVPPVSGDWTISGITCTLTDETHTVNGNLIIKEEGGVDGILELKGNTNISFSGTPRSIYIYPGGHIYLYQTAGFNK